MLETGHRPRCACADSQFTLGGIRQNFPAGQAQAQACHAPSSSLRLRSRKGLLPLGGLANFHTSFASPDWLRTASPERAPLLAALLPDSVSWAVHRPCRSSLSRLTATSSVPYTLRVWRGAAPYHTSCAVASPIIPRTGPAPLLLLLVPCAVQRSASGSAAGRLPWASGIHHPSLFLISSVLRPVRSRHARARLIRLICSIRRLLVWKTPTTLL